MDMDNTGSRGSNPDAAIAVPKNVYAFYVASLGWERNLRFQFPSLEPSEPSRQRNQKGFIAGLNNVLYPEPPKWYTIELRRPGPPSPNSATRHYPEHIVAILIQTTYTVTEGIARSIAANIRSIDRAELSRRRQRVVAGDPDRSFVVLKNRSDNQARKRRISNESAIFPARQAVHCADPQSAVTADTDVDDKIAGKLFTIQRWLPTLDADTVEPK